MATIYSQALQKNYINVYICTYTCKYIHIHGMYMKRKKDKTLMFKELSERYGNSYNFSESLKLCHKVKEK